MASGNVERLLPLALLVGAGYLLLRSRSSGASSVGGGAGPGYAQDYGGVGGFDASGILANQAALYQNQQGLADALNQIGSQGPAGPSGAPGLFEAARNEFMSAPLFTGAVVGGAAVTTAAALSRGGRFGRAAATVTRSAFRAPAAVRYGGAVGAGLALGQAGVYGLEKSGALDVVQKVGSRIPAPVRSTVALVTAPLQVVGAVSTGLAGRGTVGGNIQKVAESTGLDVVNRQVFAKIGRRFR